MAVAAVQGDYQNVKHFCYFFENLQNGSYTGYLPLSDMLDLPVSQNDTYCQLEIEISGYR